MTSSNDMQAKLFGYKPSRGDATRLRIVEAAVHCMANEGLDAVTFDRLGSLVGLGRANVRYHFRDKEDVFIAAVKLVILTAQDLTVTFLKPYADSPQAQLRAVIEASFAWIAKYPDQAKVWLVFLSLCSRSEEFHKLHHEVRQLGANRLAAILISSKNSRFNATSAHDMARHIQRLIAAELIEHLTCFFSDSLEARQARVLEKVRFELKQPKQKRTVRSSK